MRKLKEYEQRWIAARDEYRAECSKFHKTRIYLKENGKGDIAEELVMMAAKKSMSEAAKKFEKERGIFIAARNPAPTDKKIDMKNPEQVLARIAEILQAMAIASPDKFGKEIEKENKKEADRARFGNELDQLRQEALRGVELAKKSRETGRSIEELASSYEGFDDPLEQGLEALLENPEASRPENVDWMAGARAERESVEAKTTPQGEEKKSNGMEKEDSQGSKGDGTPPISYNKRQIN